MPEPLGLFVLFLLAFVSAAVATRCWNFIPMAETFQHKLWAWTAVIANVISFFVCVFFLIAYFSL
tara:strand:- start:191 stop:385 length:195 start_codon:yes stop_codon:yes gene_type:complete